MKKYALIIGASGGIGSGIARKFAEEGWNLYLQFNHGQEKINLMQQELAEMGLEIVGIQADLTTAAGIEKVISNIFSLQAVVFAGGTAHYGLFEDIKPEEMDDLWQLHVKSPILILQKLTGKLRQTQLPSIVFISSIWGQTGASCEVMYSAVKGAQIALVKGLAKELAPSGIRVNAVAPGAVDTAMLKQFTPQEITEMAVEIPLGRLGKPEEIAGAVRFLCSPESSYMTGQVLAVNGGWYT